METHCPSSSQQALCKDVEDGRAEKRRLCGYQLGAVALGLLLLSLGLSVFSLKYLWSPNPGKVYEHQYKVLLDGVETDGVMRIDAGHRAELFKMGNGSDEVLEVHDFKNGLTGIRFATQKCYIRTQTKDLPKLAELEADGTETTVGEEEPDVHVEDDRVWIPAEEPVVDLAFLRASIIGEICRRLPVHWIRPSPRAAEEKFSDFEGAEESLSVEVKGRRRARDVLDHQPVNDYRDVGIELDNRLDERGYCCQYCRRGYRYCRRYHEPLRGYWPYPYYYQGGRVICHVVMPCNWWIARMLGRV
ncbi:tenomodulin isoform X1 [Arapaima gigas]